MYSYRTRLWEAQGEKHKKNEAGALFREAQLVLGVSGFKVLKSYEDVPMYST